MHEIKQIPNLIQQLYTIVGKLEALYPERHFTPDGHLVGSIGEVMAAYYYDLVLLPSSTETHDAKSKDGRLVQIKATQIDKISLSSQPDTLLVLKILHNGESEEVYNGPGKPAWEHAGKMQKNGQRPISLYKLTKLMEKVKETNRLPRIRET